ncbi:unnamed protein product, partial [Effrenium voratum]
VITILLAGRLFWFVGQIVWLSGEELLLFPVLCGAASKTAQKSSMTYCHQGPWLRNVGQVALKVIKFVAEFLSQHVFYTMTQVSLTGIFVLFLLFSPVQRDFSPVMQGVFESMELYLKLKTFISAMMGITNGIALWLIGLELPAAWGLLTFLANFIPNIGGPAGAQCVSIVPCVISLLDERKTLYQVSAAFLAQFFLHFNIANFVEPVIFGTTEDVEALPVLDIPCFDDSSFSLRVDV